MKRAWTRGEKWLFAAPILFGVVAVAAKSGPDAARRALDYPIELRTSPANSLTSISLSKDGRILVAGEQIVRPTKATSNIIYAWNAQTLQPLAPLIRPATLREDTTLSVALSPDGQILGWSGYSFGVKFTEMKTRRLLWATGSPASAQNAEFSSDGRLVALNLAGISICQAHTGKVVKNWVLLPGSGEVAFQFSSRGRYFASSGARPVFKEWDKAPNEKGGEIELRRVKDWKIERVLPLPNAKNITFSPDETTLVAKANWFIPGKYGYSGQRLRCFNTSSGSIKWEVDSRAKGSNPSLSSVQDLCFSPDGKLVALIGFQGPVLLLDAQTGVVTRTLRIPKAQQPNCSLPHGITFSPDGKRLFARGKNAVLVWDLN